VSFKYNEYKVMKLFYWSGWPQFSEKEGRESFQSMWRTHNGRPSGFITPQKCLRPVDKVIKGK